MNVLSVFATNMTYLPVGTGNRFSEIRIVLFMWGWNNVPIVSTINILVKNWIKLAGLLKENNWGKRKIQKKLECYQSEVKKI